MMVDGSYNRILQLNWVSSDVDGDGLPELVLSGNKAGTEAPANSYALVSQPGGVSMKNNQYVIEGKVYSSWEAVPAKYKVSTGPIPPADKRGFGLAFNF